MSSGRLLEACIPMPVMPVIDDVGWWSGRNDLDNNGPARTGMPRDHVPEDYEAIVRLGKKLSMRVQAAMVLCEWDRRNMLRDLPESTWMGPRWDNSRWMGPWLGDAARIINGSRDHFEFVLHGLAHSAWPGGKGETSEWFDLKKGGWRPAGELRTRLHYFHDIMQEYGFGSFPETYVAPCNHYRFGTGPTGLTCALKRMGVKYISAGFHCHNWAAEHFPLPAAKRAAANTPVPLDKPFTVDCGILVINRVRNFFPWDAVGCRPTEEIESVPPLLGLHWPNILHADARRNGEVVDGWVDYLKGLDRKPDRMLASDTPMCWTQLAYQASIETRREGSAIHLDFSALDRLKILHLNDWFVMKIVSDSLPRVEANGVRVLSIGKHPKADDQWLVRIGRLPGQRKAAITVA